MARPISKRKQNQTFLFDPYTHRYGKLRGIEVTISHSSIAKDIIIDSSMLFEEKFRSRILNMELEKAPPKQTAVQETNPFCPLYNIMIDSANLVLNI